MEKITKTFTHDHENDTTIEYFNTGLYSGLNCSFTSEDPAYGTDTLHYNSEPAEIMEDLAYDMLQEITEFMDWRDGSSAEVSDELKLVYDEYSNSTLIAIEKALRAITKDYSPVTRNSAGNLVQLMTVKEAAKAIRDRFAKSWDVRFDFGVGVAGRTLRQVLDHDDLYQFCVKLLRNDKNLFDGEGGFETDYIFMVGMWGGGNVQMAYFCSDDYINIMEWDCDELIDAMCKSADITSDEVILLETIELKEEK